MSTKLSTLFLFAVLIIGIVSYPNVNLNSNSFDESSLNTSLLIAFAQSDTDEEDVEDTDEEDVEDTDEEDIEEEHETNAELLNTELETHLSLVLDQINNELSNPLSGFEILSENIDIEGDTLSLTAEGRINEILDLLSLEESILSSLSGTQDLDVTSDDDSLDITFEKDFGEVVINDENFVPNSSVTISVTIHDDGYTEINYDVDITLEEIYEDTEIEEEEESEIEIEVEVEGDVAKVKVEFNDQKHRFLVTDDTSEDAIADAILGLPDFPLDKPGIMKIWEFEVEYEDEEEEESEIEIEVEVEGDVAKVKVEFNDQKHRFLVTDDTSEDAIADAILELPDFPLDKAGIIEIWDFEVEEESSSLTTTEFDAYEAEQEAQELYDDLQDKINDLEERIQDLLEKYENGEYYGKVHEIDSEIMSYAISFTGFALSHDDDSVSSMDGTIYIDSLITGSNISKYAVTGGEISIDDIFYEFIFGKVRVTSSGNVVLIGQVMNWADENDDSSTIKLVIRSDILLEDGFGSESINIEILPQSKIAGQWHLSGLGTLS